MIGDDATHEGGLLWADRREVVVQRNAELAWFIDLPCIDLNFVGLRIGRSQKDQAKDECRPLAIRSSRIAGLRGLLPPAVRVSRARL